MITSKFKKGPPELIEALLSVRKHFIYAGAFSAAVNILLLVPIMYMMLVYDRVLSSGSMSTLGMLTLLMVMLLVAIGAFEWVRTYILIAASNNLEMTLRDRIFNATFRLSLQSAGSNRSTQALADLTGLRQFLTGNGIFAFFDAPWFPVYLLVMFKFHWLFGVTAIVTGIIMVLLAYITEVVTSKRLKDANTEANRINARRRSD